MIEPTPSHANPAEEPLDEAAAAPKRQARRDLIYIMGGFVAFIAVSLGLLMALSPADSAPDLSRAARAIAGDAVPLAIIHTNDTWGYTEPCG